jgi:ABC-type multidrug transport system fused ATPase/permease subunit
LVNLLLKVLNPNVEDGSFVELIAKEGRFKELWDHQVNGMVI